MTINKRERYILIVLMVAVAALLFDQVLLGWYLDMRNGLVGERTAAANKLDDAHRTLRREVQLRQLLTNMNQSLSSDATTVETGLLHQILDLQQQAGISNPSFQRSRMDQERGYTRLTFQIAGTGTQAAAAGLIYRLEMASIPLRIDSVMLRPKTEGSEELQVHLTVSTLCRGEARNEPAPVPVVEEPGAGGPQG